MIRARARRTGRERIVALDTRTIGIVQHEPVTPSGEPEMTRNWTKPVPRTSRLVYAHGEVFECEFAGGQQELPELWRILRTSEVGIFAAHAWPIDWGRVRVESSNEIE